MPDWVPYATNNTPPQEVSVDMDYAGAASFRASHPYRIAATVTDFATDADGQPSDEAAGALYEFEERFEDLCSGNDAAMVCTLSSNGEYRIYAYAAQADAAAELRQALAAQQPVVDVQSERDDAWQLYDKYALSGEELEEARDCDQIQQMNDAGEDLTFPWLVTFDATVDEARYDQARKALANAGFNADNEYLDNTVAGTTSLMLTPENLKASRTAFVRALTPFNAQYEGWGAEEPDEDAELQPH